MALLLPAASLSNLEAILQWRHLKAMRRSSTGVLAMKTTMTNLPVQALSELLEGVGLMQLKPVCLAAALLLPGAATAQLFGGSNNELDNLVFEAVWIQEDGSADLLSVAGKMIDTGSSTSEAGSALQTLRNLGEYEASIEQILEEQSLYSETLREQYRALALLQQEAGQHEAAVATFEKAIHIVRVNDGLYTLEQIDDINNIFISLEATGDKERETDFRNYLYTINQKNFEPTDVRMLAAKRAWADWNLNEYQLSAILNPDSMQLPGPFDADEFVVIKNTINSEIRFVPRRFLSNQGSALDSTRFSRTADMMVDERLETARDTYQAMLEDGSSVLSKAETDEIKLKLVAAEFALKNQMDMLIGVHDRGWSSRTNGLRSERDLITVKRGMRRSADTLQTLIDEQESSNAADLLALARSYLHLGDFNIVYKNYSRSVKAYEQAWRLLQQSGLSPAEITAILYPRPLVAVPVYAAHPYSREIFNISDDDLLEYRGYIDTKVDINRYGEVNGIKVTSQTEDTPHKVRSKLLDYLKTSQVRPALSSGKPTKQEDLNIRFYYTY